MVKKLFNLRNVLLGLCLAASGILTQAQPYAWVKGLEGGLQVNSSIATDDMGNVYISGYFSDTVDFDPGPGVANLIETPNSIDWWFYPHYDLFIAKYDAQGNYIWAKSMGGIRQESVRSMAIDSNNNIYIYIWNVSFRYV